MTNEQPTPASHVDLAPLLVTLRQLIGEARSRALRAVDVIQVQTCWEVGRHIVEFEQGGAARAAYGKRLLPLLADRLTAEFGAGFDASNLRYMRLFYQAFPKCDALRHELSWTHYRLLAKVEKAEARQWYMAEAATQNWSTRALERQIGTLFYEPLLLSQDKVAVADEARQNLALLESSPRAFVRDPVMLEFLGLPGSGKLLESGLEKGLMDMYVRMYDDLKRNEGDNPTVGILLCEAKDQSVVRYSVLNGSEQLFASRYKLVLPSEEELRLELTRDAEAIRLAMDINKSEADDGNED